MKRISITISVLFMLFMCALSFASKVGSFFNVSATGNSANVNITLCLDGNGPLSCQNYRINALNLSISTTIPNHVYPAAGIKINTPGYTIPNCTPNNLGYCLFSVSNTASASIFLSNGTSTPSTLTATPSVTLSVTGLVTTTGSNSGTPRFITITNTSATVATNVRYSISPALPSDSSIIPASCGNIAAGGTCTLTVTPGATPSAAVANSNPSSITVSIQGNNTNAVTSNINILTYGSFYQAGWLFSIIETANTSASIGGTVAGETDSAPQSTAAYSSNDEDTTTNMYSGTNGLSNTAAMETVYGTNKNYSAGYCLADLAGGYTDWYLPSFCQMGSGYSDSNFDCFIPSSPDYIPNMQANLLQANPSQSFNFVNNGNYWSSTASETYAPESAWIQIINVGGADGAGGAANVILPLGVRCARNIS